MPYDTLLQLESVSKSFGGLQAVRDLSFDVRAGTITSLIGGNGAGKTTAFNLITGNLVLDAGHIHFCGARIDGLPPHKVARAGIARGFQELRLFNRLSTSDNVETAIPDQRGEGIIRALIGGRRLKDERKTTQARAGALLRELTLETEAGSLAERLSYGSKSCLVSDACSLLKADCSCSTSRLRALVLVWWMSSAHGCATSRKPARRS